MAESGELIAKLQLRPGAKLRLISVPAEIAEALEAGPDIRIVKANEACTAIVAFARTPAEADSFAKQALKALPRDGLLWFAYRKGAEARASGLSRDTGWTAIKAAGWDTVRSISIDDEWTGLRFRPVELIKTK